jgi:DeoR/GlpR family transcriptional regulator of sugar metabolism
MRATKRRQSELLQLIRQCGRLDVSMLAPTFAVSAETIRRDLRALEQQGMISRSYGTAASVESGVFETDLQRRAITDVEEKMRIAEAAVSQLGESQTIYIDEGFNPQLIAARLPDDRPLTVATASLPTATLLCAHTNIKVMVLGGRVRPSTLGVVDDWAVELLGRLTFDLAFIGSNGVSVDRGMTTPDPAVAVIKRAAMRSSVRRIFIGAHNKFGLTSFVNFATLTDFEALITGRELPSSRAQAFRNAGSTLIRV